MVHPFPERELPNFPMSWQPPILMAEFRPEGAPDRKTAIWAGNWDWEMIPYYSDSQIFHDGHATGIFDVAENARSMREFLVDMPDYDTVVFLDGFESGSPEVWSDSTGEVTP